MHLAALDRQVRLVGESWQLDTAGFCGEVLAACGVPPARHRELAPLALWWASCGGAQPVAEGERWRCGPVSVQLRPWTVQQRARAMSVASKVGAASSREFFLGRYLAHMARASIVDSEPESLVGAAPLVQALVAHNVAAPTEEVDEQLMAVALRLGRALGWTPEQVFSAPAREVDRLLTMLDRIEGAPRRAAPARRPTLADHPDAVVIRLEDG